MKKKQYINPEMEIVKIQMSSILSTSDPDVKVDENDEIEAGEVDAVELNDFGYDLNW